MTTINELRSKVCKQAHLLMSKRGYSRKDAMKQAWKSQKTLVEYEKFLIVRNKIEVAATTWTPSTKAMQAFHSSNCYKGV